MTDVAKLVPRDQRIAARERGLLARTLLEAESAGLPDPMFSDTDESMWYPGGTRGQAIAYFASEYSLAFTECRARRRYVAIDLDAIRDLAHDIAADFEHYSDEDVETMVAYTWEGEGWLWRDVGPTDPRGCAIWEVTRA